MRHPFVVTFAATAVLTQGSCKQEEMTHNPPPIEVSGQPTVQISMNPPAQPGWDDVGSGHQGTNPPSPVLVMSKDGRCFKKFEGGMTQAGPNRVEASCDGAACGKSIRCPEGAKRLLEGGKAEIGEEKALELARTSISPDQALAGSTPEVKLYGNRYLVTFRLAADAGAGVMVWVDAITGRVGPPEP